jgi:hypothetical protein
MNSNTVLGDVRRYRAIASLYRQTAALRPLQRSSLLGQAHEWEHRAIEALEAYFAVCNVAHDLDPVGRYAFLDAIGDDGDFRIAARRLLPMRHFELVGNSPTRSASTWKWLRAKRAT